MQLCQASLLLKRLKKGLSPKKHLCGVYSAMSLRESIEKAWDPDSFESIHDLEAMIKAPLEEKSSGLPLGGETPPSWKESTAPWIIFEIGDVDLAVIRRKKKTGGKMKKNIQKKTCKKKNQRQHQPSVSVFAVFSF